MIKLIDQRAEELEKIEIASKKWEKIKTTPHRVDAQTFIFVREGHDPKQRVEKFIIDWKDFQKYDAQHVEPFLSK